MYSTGEVFFKSSLSSSQIEPSNRSFQKHLELKLHQVIFYVVFEKIVLNGQGNTAGSFALKFEASNKFYFDVLQLVYPAEKHFIGRIAAIF